MTINYDQTAAHVEAFNGGSRSAMAAHLQNDHGWPVTDEHRPSVLRTMHADSHAMEEAAGVNAHLRSIDHECHFSPLCDYWTSGPEWACKHSSCNVIVHAPCEMCMIEGYDARGEFDPYWCDEHGWTYIKDAGSNSGFAGEGVWWMNLGCGCSPMESGEYVDN